MPELTIVELIRDDLTRKMERDERVPVTGLASLLIPPSD
jgi:hypothetical protein